MTRIETRVSMLLTNPPETWHTPAKAAALAQQLMAEDQTDGWTYQVEPAGNWAKVAVFDETGAKMGYL